MPKLSIIIVNWNSGDVLRECIRSIYTSTKTDMEIIVVDNNSSDDSVAMIRREFPGVILLEKKENLGFSRGNNIGFSRSHGDFILILNPDTIILDNALDKMTEALEAHATVGILGPRIYDPDGRTIALITKSRLPHLGHDFLFIFLFDRVLRWLNRKLSKYSIYRDIFYAGFRETGYCEFISGACMLFRRETYKKLNGFNETIPMYLDDIDLCCRSIECGFKNLYLAQAEIIHIGRHSTKKSKKEKSLDLLLLQARLFYYRLHFGHAKVFLYKSMIVISIPYLLVLDLATLPIFIFTKRRDRILWTFVKHLKYFKIVFSDKITETII